ncbi:MAG TPA: glycosyl transferase family 2, partial [Verrucomicrobiales bacterium]|nr:glycosyl transferase family 2 [Verrucomicrobiales bacterium]
PHAGLFRRVVELAQTDDVLAGGCVVRTDVQHAVFDGLTSMWNRLSRRMKWMAGSFVFCRAEAFRAVGGFDERFYASEEIDLSRKLKRLARKRRQRLVIIADETLLTSGRKVRLYSKWELIRLLAQSFIVPWFTMRRRQAFWYDGRR